MRYGVLFVLILLVSEIIFGQDIHWSQVNRNPIFQNPAQCGAFKGDVRVVSNYKDQWRSVTLPFSTFSFSLDGHLKKHKNAAIGAYFFNDQAGDGIFKTLEGTLNYSYSIKFPDSTHQLRCGIGLGFNHRQLNFNLLNFDNQFDGVMFNPAIPKNENFQTDKKTNLTTAIGVNYLRYFSSKLNLSVNVSGHNLNRPNQGFYGQKIKRPIRLSSTVQLNQQLNKFLNFNYSVLFQQQGKYTELVGGAKIQYTLQNNVLGYKAVEFGIYARAKDAVILAFGLNYNNWSGIMSYDVNISQLQPASNRRGGIELSLHYIFQKFKPKNKLHRICPDFI